MVEPEPGHLLAQLIRAIQIAQERARLGFPRERVHIFVVSVSRGLLLVGIGDRVGRLALGIHLYDELGQRLRLIRMASICA
jgi:hypothetical protein